LSVDQLRQLELASKSRTFARKIPIYLPADQSRAVFLLAYGRAKICHLTGEGKQSILAFIEPGELFGELAMFEQGQRNEYAEAVEPSTVICSSVHVVRRSTTVLYGQMYETPAGWPRWRCRPSRLQQTSVSH
jgi:CRP-like cAMP-binding protein